ncbi:MAG: hypothetical protein NTY68_05280, partial [Candidatus Micrarchaeota archaeon]|nr:hypothetical protein [Candidatus Micrarchaeota archaeon]
PAIILSILTVYAGSLLNVPVEMSLLKNFLEFGIVVAIAYALCLPIIIFSVTEKEKKLGWAILNNMRERFQV